MRHRTDLVLACLVCDLALVYSPPSGHFSRLLPEGRNE